MQFPQSNNNRKTVVPMFTLPNQKQLDQAQRGADELSNGVAKLVANVGVAQPTPVATTTTTTTTSNTHAFPTSKVGLSTVKPMKVDSGTSTIISTSAPPISTATTLSSSQTPRLSTFPTVNTSNVIATNVATPTTTTTSATPTQSFSFRTGTSATSAPRTSFGSMTPLSSTASTSKVIAVAPPVTMPPSRPSAPTVISTQLPTTISTAPAFSNNRTTFSTNNTNMQRSTPTMKQSRYDARDDEDDDESDDESDEEFGAPRRSSKKKKKNKRKRKPSRASPSKQSDSFNYNEDDVFDEYDDDDDIFGDKALARRQKQKEKEEREKGPKIELVMATRTRAGTQTPEYLVKFQKKSYLHVDWLTEDEIVEREGTFGRGKVKRYWDRKPDLDMQQEEWGAEFDPDYLICERIFAVKTVNLGGTAGFDDELAAMGLDLDAILQNNGNVSQLGSATTAAGGGRDNMHAARTGGVLDSVRAARAEARKRRRGVRTMVYVKWVALTYKEATWEDLDDIEDGLEHLARYNRWNQYPPPPKPPARPWAPFAESPVFKNDNKLRSYQLEGFNWLVFCWYQGRGSILADEMGLGKTVQSIVTLDYLRQNTPGRLPFLVVAPLSTIEHWRREFEGWTELNVITYMGTAKAREIIRRYEFCYLDQQAEKKNQWTRFDVLLTSYESCTTGDWQELARLPWQAIVVDEAQRLKNAESKLSRNLMSFKSEHRILLTGTPLQNNIGELWSLLYFIEPTRFASQDEFLEQFGDMTSAIQVQQLHSVLQPHLLRRLKEDVEKSIPPKEETLVNVELTTVQKQYYRAVLDRNRTFLNKGCRSGNTPNLMNVMMQLRKLCNHPYLLQGVEDRDQDGVPPEKYYDKLIRASGKLVLLDKLLTKLRAGDHKVLIFSQMIRMLDLLETYLMWREYGFERIDGSIRGAERQAAIDRFCRPGSDRFVFLLCTRAGGVGINLTAADTVVIYDSDWNPQNDIQAQARCHRIGQDKKVQVYRLITSHTYEEHMFETSSKKLGLDQAVLHTGGLSGKKKADPNKIDDGEVNRLLRHGAYHVFNDDETAANEFVAADIDSLLERSKQVVWKGSTSNASALGSFSKASFVADTDENIQLDDEDFWTKILPEQKTAASMLEKFQENDKEVLSSARNRAAFFKDLSELVYEAVDAWQKGKGELPVGVVDLTHLVRLAKKKKQFSAAEKQQMDQWLDQLASTQTRRGRGGSKYGSSSLSNTDGTARRAPKRRKPGPKKKVVEAGTWSEHEKRRLCDALFDVAAPNFDLIRTKINADRNDVELYELCRYVLQSCENAVTQQEHKKLFRAVTMKFLKAGENVDSPMVNTPPLGLPTNATIDTDSYKRLIARHMNTWLQRLTELQLVHDVRDGLRDGQLDVPVCKIAVWWEREHDIALLDGVLKHGLRAINHVIEDEQLPFMHHADLDDGVSRGADFSSLVPHLRAAQRSAIALPPRIATGLPEEKVFASHFEFLLNYGHAVTEARRQEAELAAKDTLLIDRHLHETVRLPLPFSKSEAKRMFHAMMSTGDKNYLQLQDAAQLCDKSLRQVKELCDVLVHRANVLLMKKHVASIKIDHSEVPVVAEDDDQIACNAYDAKVHEEFHDPYEWSHDDDELPSHSDITIDENAAATFTTPIVDWLTPSLAKRLLTRLQLLRDVRRVLAVEQLKAHVATQVRRESMPVWWLPSEHDVALLRAIATYGMTSDAWQSLTHNENSPFHTNDAARRSFTDTLLVDAPALISRLHYVVRAMLRDGGVTTRYQRGVVWRAPIDPFSLLNTREVVKEPTPPPSPTTHRNVKNTKIVPRDDNGCVELPITVKGADILNLGRVVYDRPGFHAKSYIWPVGFVSRRRMPDWNDPDTHVYYTSEIVDGGKGPLFKVTHPDGTSEEHHASSGVWKAVLQRIKGRSVSVSGPEQYGFSDQTVKALIQELPNATKCRRYQWIEFDDEEDPLLGKPHQSEINNDNDTATSMYEGDGDYQDDDSAEQSAKKRRTSTRATAPPISIKFNLKPPSDDASAATTDPPPLKLKLVLPTRPPADQ